VKVLLKLYDGEDDPFENLEGCRINPDFTSENPLRNDLEYFIPQLTYPHLKEITLGISWSITRR
jgi:hypothetical protein